MSLASFPHLSYVEFVECIERFAETYASRNETRYTVDIVHGQHSETYLRIATALYAKHSTLAQGSLGASPLLADSDIEGEVEDRDPTASALSNNAASDAAQCQVSGTVEYHVLYSRTWRVPLLFFRVLSDKSEAIMDTSRVSQMLVSDSCVREAMSAVEFGGALGIQDHPVYGVPFMYLHPCNTAQLLQAVSSERHQIRIGAREYIAAWLSLVGPAAGLYLPSVAQQ
ncbi:hypothetical protein GGI12_005864 [Dipsacomyces acuminosporus]|nr:hypothetical protein GGI12_005864 [Dipsacomyces acuminosporus]